MLAVVSSRATVESFWAAMQENDWHRAAGHLARDCLIDWPCSGERIVGRENFAAIQAQYPTNTGRWSFDVHRIVAEEGIVVSEVTVTDEEQSARVVAFSILDGSQIAHQIEYWLMPYDPQPGREGLTQPIARVP
jgi:limonene-1,2-epoxide hydrolase